MTKLIPDIVPPTEEELDAFYQKRLRKGDPTRLSFWFPKLEAAGLPVPKTILVEATKEECLNALSIIGDGKESKEIHDLVRRITDAADHVGWPFFLRTDYTSAKHSWEKSCYVKDSASLLDHVLEIVEYSECASFIGEPYDIWAVRELLPTIPHGICKSYDNMPLCREFRVFVDNEKIECWHPYWPMDAIEQGDVEFDDESGYLDVIDLDDDEKVVVLDLASKAGAAVGGRWSVDILETEKGWYITDMALANVSYHWPDCPNNPEKEEDDEI
jgi:hypothetical protein